MKRPICLCDKCADKAGEREYSKKTGPALWRCGSSKLKKIREEQNGKPFDGWVTKVTACKHFRGDDKGGSEDDAGEYV